MSKICMVSNLKFQIKDFFDHLPLVAVNIVYEWPLVGLPPTYFNCKAYQLCMKNPSEDAGKSKGTLKNPKKSYQDQKKCTLNQKINFKN